MSNRSFSYTHAKREDRFYVEVRITGNKDDQRVLFFNLMKWCKERQLQLLDDYNCREVRGNRPRYEFWFKDRTNAVLFKLQTWHT